MMNEMLRYAQHDNPGVCHPERSEGSHSRSSEMLSVAKHDNRAEGSSITQYHPNILFC